MRPTLLAGAALALAAAAALADDKDRKQLKGTWTLVSATHGGKAVPQDKLGKATVTFDGETMTVAEDGRKKTARYKLDPTKAPPHIDIFPQEGDDKGKTVKGLYELKGDTLRLCFGRPDEDRPTAIESRDGGRVILAEFKQAKE